MRVVTIGTTRWVFGADWQYLPGLEHMTPEAEARITLRSEKATYGVLYLSGERHVLGVVRAAAAMRKAFSAAAAAAALPRLTLLVAQVEGDYWICVAGGGRLDIKYDQLLDTFRANESIDTFLGARASQSAQDIPIYIVGDCDLDNAWLSGAEHKTWADILSPDQPPESARVRQLGGRALREKVIVLGAIVSVLGFFAWDHYASEIRKQKALEAALSEQAAREAAQNASEAQQREASIQQAVRQSLELDTATPEPLAVYEACADVARGVGRFLGGYQVLEIGCGSAGASIAVALTHPAEPTFGTPETLTAAAEKIGGVAQLAADLRTGTVMFPLQAFGSREPVAEVQQLPRLDEYASGPGSNVVALLRGDQQAALDVKPFAPKPITYPDPTNYDENGAPVSTPVPDDRGYVEATLVFSAPRPGRIAMQAYNLPNFRLDSVTFRPDPERLITTATYKVILQP